MKELKSRTLPADAQIKEISSLSSHLGWELFNEYLDSQIDRTQAHILGVAKLSGEELVHARATYQTLKAVKDWARSSSLALNYGIELDRRAKERRPPSK